MRRTIITAVAVTALAIPGAAIASHQGEHQAHAGRHGVHHKRHHRHAHLVRFGTSASTQAAAPTGSTSPAPVAGSADETAGTIASFTGGTLTITLNDGSTVGGKVTEATEIECRSAIASAASDGHGDHGGQLDQGDDHGDEGGSSSGSHDGQQGDVSGHDDGDDEQQEAGPCTPAALIPGAVVREAELRVSSAGAVWEKVELNQ